MCEDDEKDGVGRQIVRVVVVVAVEGDNLQ